MRSLRSHCFENPPSEGGVRRHRRSVIARGRFTPRPWRCRALTGRRAGLLDALGASEGRPPVPSQGDRYRRTGRRSPRAAKAVRGLRPGVLEGSPLAGVGGLSPGFRKALRGRGSTCPARLPAARLTAAPVPNAGRFWSSAVNALLTGRSRQSSLRSIRA